MAEPSVAIDVHGLGHRYGERRALQDVSFSVKPAEIVGLLGPNGGGKTTLFRILATLLRPSEGDAFVRGRSVLTDPDGVRRLLGVVFQRPSLDLKLTVRENLMHHGRLHGLSGGELRLRCDAMLAAVGVGDRAGDRVASLSGGLQRRVELAKGLLHRPSVLLLDEPNTGLDPNARREFLDHLEQRRRHEGVTALLTTHFMEEAERCDRVGILHEGKLVAFDEPGRLKASLGGDVVTIACREPRLLQTRIKERLGLEPIVVGGALRLETREGHLIVGRLLSEFRDEIGSVTWGQPTLDDVFVRLTGRRLDEEAAA